jgi:hypothetical protein
LTPLEWAKTNSLLSVKLLLLQLNRSREREECSVEAFQDKRQPPKEDVIECPRELPESDKRDTDSLPRSRHKRQSLKRYSVHYRHRHPAYDESDTDGLPESDESDTDSKIKHRFNVGLSFKTNI